MHSDSRNRKESEITLTSKEGHGDKVRVSISHAGMTSSMRSLNRLTTKVSTQGDQQELGSKVINDQALREITNRDVVRPNKLKSLMPTSKLSGSKWVGEGVRLEGIMGCLTEYPSLTLCLGGVRLWVGLAAAGHPTQWTQTP